MGQQMYKKTTLRAKLDCFEENFAADERRSKSRKTQIRNEKEIGVAYFFLHSDLRLSAFQSAFICGLSGPASLNSKVKAL